jgi:hypothetical protein
LKYLSVLGISLLLLTGCAEPRGTTSPEPEPTASDSENYPTPAIADNRVPKTCQLPALQNLASELAGASVNTVPNPVNRQNSNAENYQAYLDGLYLVCIYELEDKSKYAYIFYREADPVEWAASMEEANLDLEEGELPFERISLGLGELDAFYLLEQTEEGNFFNAHSMVDNISIVVFTNLANDQAAGKRFLEAAINSMP